MFNILHSLVGTENEVSVSEPHSLDDHSRDIRDSKTVLSVIHCNKVGPATVDHHSLGHDIGHPQLVPGVIGYKLLNDTSEIEDTKIRKYIRRSAIEKLEHLLRNVSATDNPAVKIGKRAFICSPQMSEESGSLIMSEVFHETQLHFSNGVKSTQYFNARCPTIKPALLDGTSPVRFKSIHINTGICLVSKAVLGMVPGHGQDDNCIIPMIPQNDDPTLYELETVARLSSAVADVAALCGGCSNQHTALSVNIDVPDFQYYWTACELFAQKLVSISYVQSWMAVIGRRKTQLQNMMASAIDEMLMDRGIRNVEVNFASAAEAAVALLQERVPSGVMPSLEELLIALKTQGADSAQWRDFFTHLDRGNQPSTVAGLGRLIYIFEVVKHALECHAPLPIDEKAQGGHHKKLIIFVDDSMERRIFDKATTFIRGYSERSPAGTEGTIIVGLFPMQRILVAGSGRSDLYTNDPGPHLCLHSSGARISPFDIISTTHGSRTARRLQRSCTEQGFRTRPQGFCYEKATPFSTKHVVKLLGTCATIGAIMWLREWIWS
ncbi:hypothetical protein N7510_003069 [Penicillium lagena]|uniref:uncharacterized protein n=1 Tax=Penicillium lagena TaxID=94218 RepID=UPI0025423450|nr:uncharacterized protein N7510_003069 [Penicillium lagena]KAJ5619085.1 hypothetical protein N7510_003069 [Penicillium lagena]